ncbi:MAG: hypothetical protein IJW49_04430 [Clostridia bacterium]|nr:hypothetical protein [Clostridia bacterium]
MNLPLEFFLTSLTKSSKNLVFQEERYPVLTKCRYFESLLLEEKASENQPVQAVDSQPFCII